METVRPAAADAGEVFGVGHAADSGEAACGVRPAAEAVDAFGLLSGQMD